MSPREIVFVACAAACVLGHVAIVASTVGRRVDTDQTSADIPRPRLAVEVAWALLPVVALAFVLTATWSRVREHAAPRPVEVMKVAR